jgi:membrane-associated protease RseP (regulator of RpoE activity)
MTEPTESYFPYPPVERPPRSKRWKHLLLFVATFVTTTLVGAAHYLAFQSEFGRVQRELDWWLLAGGLWYSGGVLAILGMHEMGHYLACRYYRLDASLPYFLPFIVPIDTFQTGTLGAIIRIRAPFPTRTILFDIGVAGPIAGFVVLVPVLFAGLALSQVLPLPEAGRGVYLGEPLLFQWATELVLGPVREGYGLNAHPMVFAAWFGMLATALNLLPFGQLDGGHITYAALGRYSTPISILTVGTAVVMTFISTSWLMLTVMMVVMLVILGPRHPRVIYEWEPLAPGRRTLALVALLILALCFTPTPIEPYDLLAER